MEENDIDDGLLVTEHIALSEELSFHLIKQERYLTHIKLDTALGVQRSAFSFRIGRFENLYLL